MAPGSASPVSLSSPQLSYYMRELPTDKLVGYETPEGKELFKEALLEGGLEAFFPLSQQFLTQNEPAYCGLGTLCMILNALRVDPGATWRSPWRWFTQEMLDCCRPLEWVKQNGITLAEFSCLAKCNGLDATTKYADQSPFEDFEAAVKACARSTDKFLAVSYSRACLGQTGSGHFSPAGGYCSRNGGMVLILDVARFKYPSYWVPIRMLYEALIPYDAATNQPRGYSILRRPSPEKPTLRALLTLNATTPTWPSLYTPLASVAESAESYTELVTTLATILQSPSGLPAVSSRLEGKSLNSLSASTRSPSFNAAEGIKVHSEYRANIDHLHRYFSRHSVFAREISSITDDLWKTEITVFLLAILSSRDLMERMSKTVKEEVEEKLRVDLEDEHIAQEVELVKRQIESLTDCSLDEGSCVRPKGKKCCSGGGCGERHVTG